jgi:glycosyltransferase involved in cell wall biosynthesis
MAERYIIDKKIGSKVLMIGVYYANHAPGGMAAVIQYYEKYFEKLRYISSWKMSNSFIKLFYGVLSYMNVFFILIFDRRVKLLHIHSAADGSFWRKSMFMKLGKAFKKKVILHVHASRFKDFYNESAKKNKIIKNLQMADSLIVLSESWKKWFIGIGIREDRIEVLHNITEYPSISKKNSRGNKKVRFLFLGELGQRKGVFDILRGLINHKDELKDKIELRIGGNTNEEKLIRIIKEGGVEGFVKFEGWVAGDKKIKLLNWADIYILPSFNEGLPIGILEAMSYGCPIISTPVGGIPEVVIPDENGVFVTPGNSEEIVSAMKSYVLDPSIIIKQGAASKKMVETYLPNDVLAHLKKIYLKLMLN